MGARPRLNLLAWACAGALAAPASQPGRRQAERLLRLLENGRASLREALTAVSGRQEAVYAARAPVRLRLSPFQSRILEYARKPIAGRSRCVRVFCLSALGRLGDKEDAVRARPFLASEDPETRRAALTALWRLCPAEGAALAARLLNDPSPRVLRAALAIAAARPGDQVDLADGLPDDEARLPVSVRPGPRTAEAAEEAELIAAARRLLRHRDARVRCEAGLVLLSRRVQVDYAPLAQALSCAAGAGAVGRVLAALRRSWPTPPPELYPVVKRACRGPWRSEALPLIPRFDAEALPLRSPAEREEYRLLARAASRPHDNVPPRRPAYALAFFHQDGCGRCLRVHKWIVQLGRELPGLEVRRYNIRAPDAAILNEALCERFHLSLRHRQITPAVFTAAGALVGKQITPDRLRRLVAASRGLPAPWEDEAGGGPEQTRAAERRLRRRGNRITPAWVFLAGLADGLNPCAFTVILFFLSYLYYVGYGRRAVLGAGAAFTGGVLAAYLLIGWGALRAVYALRGVETLSAIVRWAAAALAGAAGAMSFRDGLRAARGRAGDAAMRLPRSLQRAIHAVIRRQARLRFIAAASCVVGFLVSLLEFACTGQVYLPTLVLISRGAASGLAMLLLYNLAFIMPLIAVFCLAWCGVASEELTHWFRRRAAAVRFALAAVFLGLAALLIF